MKAVILAGGLGTRLSEETSLKPKPMVEIGGKPILWHIMKIYSSYGINDFIVCCGYKGYVIKEYFANYQLHLSDVEIDLASGVITPLKVRSEPWKVTLVDTGEHSMTGGRLKRVAHLLQDEDMFCFTYGDGVSDVNISESVEYHRRHKKMATMTTVMPPGRFGSAEVKGDKVVSFAEKPRGEAGLINGGFFVLSPQVIDLIEGDETDWEQGPLNILAESGECMAFRHEGFWQPMDTLRDRNYLERLWNSKKAPWKRW